MPVSHCQDVELSMAPITIPLFEETEILATVNVAEVFLLATFFSDSWSCTGSH